MGMFSIFRKEGEYFGDRKEFIELVSCPRGGKTCVEHRKIINNKIVTARKHFLDKKFPQSIEELKIAYDKTTELQLKSCLKCAEFYRSSITNTMEYIHDDLKQMSEGFFKSKRHQPSYLLAAETLEDFRKNIKA